MVSMDKAFEKKEASFRGADLKLFVRDVRDRQGRKRPITVRSWSTIKDVKDTIQKAIHIPPSSQRLYFGPLMTSGKELPNHRSLHDAGIYRSGETILLDIKGSSSETFNGSASFSLNTEAKNDVCISSSVIDSTPRPMKQLVQKARRALALGLKPEFILEGSGGTYFLHDSRKVKIGVFKPADEEPYAENNPRGYLQQTGQEMYLRQGVVPGEACIREVAAFMLDHGGFSAVPMTTLVEARHPSFNANGSRLKVSEGGASIGHHSINHSTSSSSPSKKVGSFQEFVRSECSMDDISPSMISVDEVHKIAILDIRIMNADRNSANLLCRRRSDNSLELLPIDHGFCLRSVADVSWMDWCWLDWPQMKQPISKRTRDYILNLDIERDARLLKERMNICREALDYFCASSSILKAGVRAGLSLYEIAIMCCRNDNLGEVPSKLEVLFSMAAELADSAIENGRWHHAAASRALEEQLSPKGGSLLATTSKSPGVHKALSAVDLMHYGGLDDLADEKKKEPMPGMIHSSASDSSSDNGDGEVDDCEEWAANLIADVSLEQSMSLITKKGRSPSIESESSNESDGEGFWYINPGTSPEPSDDSDSDSVSWGPSSPIETSLIEAAAARLRKSYNPFDNERRSSVTFAADDLNESYVQFQNPPHVETKVTFADRHNDTKGQTDRIDDLNYKHSNSDVGALAGQPLIPPQSKMKRSQSYSALTTTMAEAAAVEEEKAKLSRPIDHDQYRDYFLKFVDLVIVRETTAASRLLQAET